MQVILLLPLKNAIIPDLSCAPFIFGGPNIGKRSRLIIHLSPCRKISQPEIFEQGSPQMDEEFVKEKAGLAFKVSIYTHNGMHWLIPFDCILGRSLKIALGGKNRGQGFHLRNFTWPSLCSTCH